jgi:hypothetical protein
VVLVTHDLTLAARAGRMIRLADGAVVEDRESNHRESEAPRVSSGLESLPSRGPAIPDSRARVGGHAPIPDGEVA